MHFEKKDLVSKYPKSLTVEGEFEIREAAEHLSKKLKNYFSIKKVLRLAAEGYFDVIAEIYEPVGLAHIGYEDIEDDGFVAENSIIKGIECFSGFFVLTHLDKEEGAHYLRGLAIGEKGAGISQIRKEFLDEDGFEESEIYWLKNTNGDCWSEALLCEDEDYYQEYYSDGFRIYPSIEALTVSAKDLADYILDVSSGRAPITKKQRESKVKKERYSQMIKSIRRLGYNSKAMLVGDGQIREVFEDCQREKPDSFSITFETFEKKLWRQAKDDGVIIYAENVNDHKNVNL